MSNRKKVSRCGRKLLPRLGEQREARCQRSKKRSKVKRKSKQESKLESRDKEVTEIISTKRQIPKSKLSSVCQELQQSDILARVLCEVEADNVHFSTFPARSFTREYARTQHEQNFEMCDVIWIVMIHSCMFLWRLISF